MKKSALFLSVLFSSAIALTAEQMLMSLEDMFNKLMIQQDGHVKFFNQLKKINM